MATPCPEPDRITGCLMGGAIGDALGAPVEGTTLDRIREEHGPDGLAEYASGPVGTGAITDDTQLTMLTAQALVQASVRAREKGIGGATTGVLQSTYLTWLQGQGEEIPRQDVISGWLGADPAMTERRGPGRTVISALRKAAARRKPGWPLGTVAEPINDSKGCAGVVRVAPCGFVGPSPEHTFALGCATAALTHGHPTGHLSAGTLAATVSGLVRGVPVREALDRARAELERHDGHWETSAALDAAVDLAAQGPPSPERLEELGAGWTAEEALAIAVCVALCAEAVADDLASRAPFFAGRRDLVGERCLRMAVNHSGDSDSTGSICGNLLGARYGTAVLPGRWQSGLEVRSSVIHMAADRALEFGPAPPTDPGFGVPPVSWFGRYGEA
ncbi:ADP-ribosylglycohydrolase family protein [Nocardiopsis lucentensis]|uniref:ADP-ribosylglycohydrolase family protein n=1 Tax=Nocardiopsis lucentensis TaxID=53441 RepID=UPI0003459E8D|nr:ADP-ribosylglycohydrolase family protein [Nocardiopsis lucentensis]